ncbi:MAG TPA: hypothetical protein VFT50_15540 [Baekduia sp.]|nr:hypothetical protein [Baekduia sp.]
MNDRFDVMPDYLRVLELELRRQALVSSRVSRRRLRWRRPALIPVIAGLIITAVLLNAGSMGSGMRAYAYARILDTPAVPLPGYLARGFALVPGGAPQGRLDEARPISAVVGATVLTGDAIWCLSVPDAAAVAGPGFSCVQSSEFFRFGISIAVGHQYVAVLPTGVRNPTLTRNGVTVTLRPDRQGVIAVNDFHHGDTITLYSVDGKARPDHAR